MEIFDRFEFKMKQVTLTPPTSVSNIIYTEVSGRDTSYKNKCMNISKIYHVLL